MSLMVDLKDAVIVEENLPALTAEIEAIVTEMKTQEDAAAKIAALSAGIAQLASTVAAIAAGIEDNSPAPAS